MITEEQDKAHTAWRREMEHLARIERMATRADVDTLDVPPHLAGRV
jgi:hypothetical protein